MRYYKESPPLLLHACSRRQVHPLFDGEGDVSGGRDGIGAVQHAERKGILQQHHGYECRVQHLL